MNTCPVCSARMEPFITCTDYTVSGEGFAIEKCGVCGFLRTVSPPSPSQIGSYYKAESYISHSDTRKGLISKLYHAVRVVMLNRKRAMVSALAGRESGSLLDIGCGTGSFLHHMQQNGWQVTGLEPDNDARKVALNKHGLTLSEPETLFTLPYNHFHVITLWHVLEHVHTLHEYMAQIAKLMAPDGLLVLALPNPGSFDAKRWGRDWAAWDVPRHLWHFSPESVNRLAQQHGFKVVAQKPMPFDAFYVSMLSSGYAKRPFPLLDGVICGVAGWVQSWSRCNASSSVIYFIRRV